MRDANAMTREYLDRILIEERIIDSVTCSTDYYLWGEKFSTPIMTPAFSHLGVYGENRDNGLVEYSNAVKEINAVNWVGMGENDAIGEVLDTGARTIRIIKPYADREKILNQIDHSKAHNAMAVGIDIDHIFGTDGEYDVVLGEKMISQNRDEIKELVDYAGIPFVVKGVLSVSDALKCAECGVQGIVVSHHHGRLPYAIPPIMVLPKIKEALKAYPQVKIFVDCSIDTGADAFKAIALGADAVSVGRAILPSLEKEGVEGAKKYINRMTAELKYIMNFTGAAKLKDIDSSVLWDGTKVYL